MSARGFQPWRKGPATILPFPIRWHRAWLVCPVEGAAYRGEVHGEGFDGPRVTEAGDRELVMAALQQPEYRRGLPILSSEGAGQ